MRSLFLFFLIFIIISKQAGAQILETGRVQRKISFQSYVGIATFPTANIVNELGEVVRTISIQNQGKQQISLSNLSSGIYFIVGQREKESYRQKIVVVK